MTISQEERERVKCSRVISLPGEMDSPPVVVVVVRVDVPVAQTCCGQPAYNNGDLENARKLAKQVIETFSPY